MVNPQEREDIAALLLIMLTTYLLFSLFGGWDGGVHFKHFSGIYHKASQVLGTELYVKKIQITV